MLQKKTPASILFIGFSLVCGLAVHSSMKDNVKGSSPRTPVLELQLWVERTESKSADGNIIGRWKLMNHSNHSILIQYNTPAQVKEYIDVTLSDGNGEQIGCWPLCAWNSIGGSPGVIQLDPGRNIENSFSLDQIVAVYRDRKSQIGTYTAHIVFQYENYFAKSNTVAFNLAAPSGGPVRIDLDVETVR